MNCTPSAIARPRARSTTRSTRRPRSPASSERAEDREIVLRDTGATSVKLVGFLRRKPGHSRDEFAAHWEHVHGPLFLGSEEVGAYVTKYVQNHVLEDFTGVMGDRYDGVAEIGLARIEDVPKLFARNHLDVVRPDLERFVDLEDMIVVVTDEVLLYEDGLGPLVHEAVPA
jgi:uncharacterized protein (TIGR02118 family)